MHPFVHTLRHYLAQLTASDLAKQLAPLIVFLLIPALVLTATAHRTTLLRPFYMVFDALSLAFPWNWSNGHSSNGAVSERERSKLKKKIVRSRAEQLTFGLNGDASGSGKDAYEDEGYYPGIVNISGTYCFMDSTLQAMASLFYLQPYVDEVHARAELLDVPTPVVDAFRDILHTLNTPKSSPQSLRPLAIIDALANHSKGKHNALFSSREHQDAQELFQLLSEAVKSEASAVYKEGLRDRGLGALAKGAELASKDIIKGVFDGLTANRRSCKQCGYTEAVMHFSFDNWQLAVPRQQVCRLEECLADYTRLEVLTDCICRKCSMVATYQRLEQEAERLTEALESDPDPSSSKRKRAREARRLALKMKTALAEGRIEEDIKGVTMEKVMSLESTKQSMIARPPPVLALHLNRSLHFGHYATKNNCRVHFPEVLDLTPFTTSGKLSTSPSSPISAPPPPLPLTRSTTPTPAMYASPRTLYRLSAVVCHYGQHSFGHYVCFRRTPRPPSAGARRFAPPQLLCPLGCDCEKCERYGPIREADGDPPEWCPLPGTGRGWLRISDDSVRECGIESVMQEGTGAFMLYYERVVDKREGIYGAAEARCSEETLKPCANGEASGSRASLADGLGSKGEQERNASVGIGSLSSSPPRAIGRIVRNVTAQRSTRSLSRANSTDPHTGVKNSDTAGSVANGDAHGHSTVPPHPPQDQLSPKQPSTPPLIASSSRTPATQPHSDPQPSSQPQPQVHSHSHSHSHPPTPAKPPTPITPPEEPESRARGHARAPDPPVRRSSHSPARSPSRSLSPPAPARHLQQQPASSISPASVRLKAPQPIYATTARPLSPPRTVGLRA